ncbi:glycosyltransferase family 2 protein [Rickettsiella endosymbiont of Xylota segnis]|uniref:glycosyltransferase family 2 protein n=1 Tax=Rickettsiella endosymbiont of Xylota segnis TaxID=3066238 RepID=UPI0030D22AD6
MQLISVVTPCYNEEANILDIYQTVKNIFNNINKYQYEHIFIDNSSSDNSISLLKEIAHLDSNVKLIINSRNFGWIRSPFYGLLQASGDAIIYMAADFQDPPNLINKFIKKWEDGFKIVIGTKSQSEESFFKFFIRRFYYKFADKISDLKLLKNFTGFGLYDKSVIQIMRQFNDPYPYLRGMISEVGFDVAEIEFKQPKRKKGLSSGTFFRLYDVAMLGITTHSKLPLRILSLVGFSLAFISLLISIIYIIAKLLFWSMFPLGFAPILIGSFFFFSMQMFFVGLLGEYIASIHHQVLKRPLVIEKERINF